MAFALCLAGLAALSAILFVAGAHKNAEITALRHHGVPVEVTVTGCLAMLSGSGSNAAGDTCHGTFELDGQRYSATIPGDALLPPGSTLRLFTAKSDPGILATAHQVRSEQASWRVFILPVALLMVLLALVTAVTIRRRRGLGTVGSAGTPFAAGLGGHQPLLG